MAEDKKYAPTLEGWKYYTDKIKSLINDIDVDLLVSITYDELKTLRNNSQLVKGMQYRITDYQCTTSTENTQSAGHQFDIIVTADSENILNENARAIKHDDDTYFDNCHLEAWELKYCLDNDSNRFAWADLDNGKGVIFYMKDEWNNECPYDFKNILYKLRKLTSIVWNSTAPADVQSNYEDEFVGHYVGSWFRVNNWGDVTLSDTDVKYFYTFNKGESDADTVSDGSIPNADSIDNMCRQNVIPEYVECDGENKYVLNWIIFKPFSNEDDCFANVFGKNCCNNLFDYSWTHENSFGNGCYGNSFGNGCYGNSFGNDCSDNSFGNDCSDNSFGNDCSDNSFGNDCYSNSFGNDCERNSFGNGCRDNSFGNDCDGNSFGNDCYSNSFGNDCYRNSFGNDCERNSFGNYCYRNSFGRACYSNSFGNDCSNIKFGSSGATASTDDDVIKSYYQYITIESGNWYIYLNCTSTTSSSQPYRNVIIGKGVNNTTTYKTITDANTNQAYETRYLPDNSQTIFV